MKSMKVALINNVHYCKFPDGITAIESFICYMNENYHSFVALEYYVEEGCIAPFFIEGELKTEKQYFNPSSIRVIMESEVYILRRYEYEEKLKKVIAEKCVQCANYTADCSEEHLESYIERIDLNGKCYEFDVKK